MLGAQLLGVDTPARCARHEAVKHLRSKALGCRTSDRARERGEHLSLVGEAQLMSMPATKTALESMEFTVSAGDASRVAVRGPIS